jgi:hypothetical protein
MHGQVVVVVGVSIACMLKHSIIAPLLLSPAVVLPGPLPAVQIVPHTNTDSTTVSVLECLYSACFALCIVCMLRSILANQGIACVATSLGLDRTGACQQLLVFW